MKQISHNDVIELIKDLASKNTDIKTCYRWNLKEFQTSVRPGTEFPLMTVESPTVEPGNSQSNLLLNFRCAFNILGMKGVDTYSIIDEESQNKVLENSMGIALEVTRKLMEVCSIPFLEDNTTKNPWYAILDPLSIVYTKIGPVTNQSLYGYRCEFTLNPKFYTTPTKEKWK